jgi:hypothetical protein
MTDDAFIIIEPTKKPEPTCRPKPIIPEVEGRTFDDLQPAQKARVARRQNGPFFLEPIFGDAGETGRWRVGREVASLERTIGEYDNKDEAMTCFQRLVTEFWR